MSTVRDNPLLDKAHRNSAWATLPVRKKNGQIELIPWGRRSTQEGKLPMGGSARREAIHAGRWDRFKPKPVRLAISSFMVKDFEGNSHWYDLTRCA